MTPVSFGEGTEIVRNLPTELVIRCYAHEILTGVYSHDLRDEKKVKTTVCQAMQARKVLCSKHRKNAFLRFILTVATASRKGFILKSISY